MPRKAHKRRAARNSGAVQQAVDETSLRFLPQGQALSQLLRDTQADYKTSLSNERVAAAGISRANRAAIPGVQRDYATARTVGDTAANFVGTKLAPLSAAADDIKAAAAAEHAAAQMRLGAAEAQTVGEFRTRAADAISTGARGVALATQKYQSDAGRIRQQQSDLAQQSGLFAQTSLRNIKDAEAQRNLTRRGQSLTYKASVGKTKESVRYHNAQIDIRRGIDPKTGKPLPTKPGQGRKNPVTKDAQGAVIDQLNVAVQTIKNLPGVPSRTLRSWLTTGYTTKPDYDRYGKKVPGTGGTTIPKIAHGGPIDAHTIINAAFDLATFNHLSHPNRVALKGVHLPAKWRGAPPKPKPRTGGAAPAYPGERPT